MSSVSFSRAITELIIYTMGIESKSSPARRDERSSSDMLGYMHRKGVKAMVDQR